MHRAGRTVNGVTLPRFRRSTLLLAALVLTLLGGAVWLAGAGGPSGPRATRLVGRTLHGYDGRGVERYRLRVPRGMRPTVVQARGRTSTAVLAGGGSTLIVRSGLTPPDTSGQVMKVPESSMCADWIIALARTAGNPGPSPMAGSWVSDGVIQLGSVGGLSGACAPRAGVAVALVQPARYTTEYRSARLGAVSRSLRLPPHFDQQPAPVASTTTLPVLVPGTSTAVGTAPGGLVPGAP